MKDVVLCLGRSGTRTTTDNINQRRLVHGKEFNTMLALEKIVVRSHDFFVVTTLLRGPLDKTPWVRPVTNVRFLWLIER